MGIDDASFASFVAAAKAAGELVVQPRMGFTGVEQMRAGLIAVRDTAARTAGTVTLDSYTRVGLHLSALRALRDGVALNGFPLVAHGSKVTRKMLDSVAGPDFPVQIRHGAAIPGEIFHTLVSAGVDATEGGPVSYCLPYSRTPLTMAVDAWSTACETLAMTAARGRTPHLETFGGCMLGQLCPPSLLVALSVLEAVFFRQHGLHDISLSYAQQTNMEQDVEAVAALRRLAGEFLPGVRWHVVLYTYMGVFPKTEAGAVALLKQSARLAVRTGSERLIVKTVAEAYRIPTIEENIQALETAARTAALERRRTPVAPSPPPETGLYDEARQLVDACLELHPDVGVALIRAFRRGFLDVPYCLHADNRGQARSQIDADGRLSWVSAGAMPIRLPHRAGAGSISARQFLDTLTYVERAFDNPALTSASTPQSRSRRRPELPAAAPGDRPGPGDSVVPEPSPAGRPWTVAIVGMGPRGISVLERLAARLDRPGTDRPVRIVTVDAVEVGAGRVWRTDQDPWFTMNTVVGQVTMYSGEPDRGPARAGAGPSLGQWLAGQATAGGQPAGPNDYATRVTYGRYLRSVFETVIDRLPPLVDVVPVRAEVTAVRRRPGRGFELELDGGADRLSVDKVVLATGHPRVEPDRHERDFLAFADEVPQLGYVAGDSAADMPLDTIPAGARVGIRGLGLSFYDVMLSLTVGRGGRFVDTGGGVRYVPSGAEPVLIAGSRSGLPIPARGRNQKGPTEMHQPRFLTREALRAARERARADGTVLLDFTRDVLPLVRLEVFHVYFAAYLRARDGRAVAESFARDDVAIDPRDDAARRRLRSRYGLGDVEPLDLVRLARPFVGERFDSPAAFRSRLVAMLQADLAEAERGNLDGPLKAALDAMRDIRGAIREAVDFGGLRPASFRDDFLDGYVPVNSLLSAGPPIERVQQLVALLEAGLLHIVGPAARFECDRAHRCFSVHSPQVDGSRQEISVLIDARIPKPQLASDRSPLTRQLLADGLVAEYVMTDPATGERFATGGLAVTPAPYHVVDADGGVDPDLYALGIPTEHTRWFTQVGSSRPGGATLFYADADAIAADVLRGPAEPADRPGDRLPTSLAAR